jgi:hypothetical protein
MALKLLKEVGCPERVVQHCQAIVGFAEKIASECKK